MSASPLTTKAAEIRAGLVADWRKAMEGVTLGPWPMEVESSDRVHEAEEDRQPDVYVCSSGTQCDYTVVATMGRAESIPHMRKSFDASWIARCSPAGISDLLALIEQQAAELAAATKEAHGLALSMWRSHYREASPNWQAFDDPLGLLTQIDNMYAGLREKLNTERRNRKAAESERDELLREKQRLEGRVRARTAEREAAIDLHVEAQVELQAAKDFGGGFFWEKVSERTRDIYRTEARKALGVQSSLENAPAGLADANSKSPAPSSRSERIEVLEAEIGWYGEQARLARLIHREGDAGRQALAADGGKRARAVLARGVRG